MLADSSALNWLLVAIFVVMFFGPALVSIWRHRHRGGETRRQAAARYGRHGYEARRRISLVEADEVDAAWRDSLPDAVTAPTTKSMPVYRGEPL